MVGDAEAHTMPPRRVSTKTDEVRTEGITVDGESAVVLCDDEIESAQRRSNLVKKLLKLVRFKARQSRRKRTGLYEWATCAVPTFMGALLNATCALIYNEK
ncbi:hypothetical protein L917_21270 [Phytophthora nicotianae]|uniref:Uncharacterized protein n=1 Tax=Phytophthora nicotianae TaxID=4792 RepID=W2JZT1_PHYNI|nr:hypothetical protein L917_21270 [Phytophthora nicotianae]